MAKNPYYGTVVNINTGEIIDNPSKLPFILKSENSEIEFKIGIFLAITSFIAGLVVCGTTLNLLFAVPTLIAPILCLAGAVALGDAKRNKAAQKLGLRYFTPAEYQQSDVKKAILIEQHKSVLGKMEYTDLPPVVEFEMSKTIQTLLLLKETMPNSYDDIEAKYFLDTSLNDYIPNTIKLYLHLNVNQRQPGTKQTESVIENLRLIATKASRIQQMLNHSREQSFEANTMFLKNVLSEPQSSLTIPKAKKKRWL